ncbi:MAG: hypothetical protein GC160_09715 [Acidobacteria bacterium]|nr:hypothetical protein [Acidobacteriota bacterium]
MDTGTGSLESAVRQSRRRLLLLSGLRWACAAAAIALVGFILLLALGTDRFPGGLLWLFALGGAGWAGWRWHKGRPADYEVAQALDQRWNASDQISTAWFFSSHEVEPTPASEAQRKMALAAASGHEVTTAFPVEWPRAASFAAALLGLALLLLTARLALQPQLSLEPPLTHVLFPSLAQPETELATLEEKEDPAAPEAADEPQSLSKKGERAERREAQQKPPAETPPALAETAQQPGEPFQMPEVEGLTIEPEAGDELAFESKEPGSESAKPGEEANSGEQGPSETAENQKDPAGDWSEKSNNLLDRLKEAFQDMMENLGMEPPQSASSEQQQGGEAAQQGQEGSQQSSEPGGEQAQAEQGSEGGEAEMEGGEPGAGDPQQTAQGQGNQNTSEEGSQQSQSAAASGSADGSKELAERMAEQQAALDALEEFYMQRSEEMEGEIMVETSAAEQTAQTPYQASRQTHTDRGGAISRDEVPLAYQRYIETYFRNLRRNNQN